MVSSAKAKKDLNFDINLLPVFDILSCCICFLLMTVAWIQVGSMNVNQAVGSEGQTNIESSPAVWAYLNPRGEVTLTLKNARVENWNGESIIPGARDGRIMWNLVDQRIQAIRNAVPNLSTAFIMPSQKIAYQDIIRIMDSFRQMGVKDVGITPL